MLGASLPKAKSQRRLLLVQDEGLQRIGISKEKLCWGLCRVATATERAFGRDIRGPCARSPQRRSGTGSGLMAVSTQVSEARAKSDEVQAEGERPAGLRTQMLLDVGPVKQAMRISSGQASEGVAKRFY